MSRKRFVPIGIIFLIGLLLLIVRYFPEALQSFSNLFFVLAAFSLIGALFMTIMASGSFDFFHHSWHSFLEKSSEAKPSLSTSFKGRKITRQLWFGGLILLLISLFFLFVSKF